MKKITSIKTRITIWYTSLMFILIVVVLGLVGGLSYQLSKESIEKNVVLSVTQVIEKLARRQRNVFEIVEEKEEFKNVSIYDWGGNYVVGKYIYDLENIPFKEGVPRRESINGKEYIVYDAKAAGHPGQGGFWIRGLESVDSTMLLGRSAMIIVLILIPLILLLTALGGYYITKKAFRPINNITKTANDISVQQDITIWLFLFLLM